MKLTIVLTVYNKEKYLRRALDSILSQTETEVGEYEVLVVNDGSKDGSSAIIEEYAHSNPLVRVLTQENQGLSMARNHGTEEAKGDYVWYVDADDIIASFSVRKICDVMVSQPDIISIYAQTQGINKIRNEVPVSVKTGKDILLSHKWQSCGVFNIFRRSFLLENGLMFLPGIYHEDAEFTPRVLYTAKSVVVVPEVLYTVIHEPFSITQVPRVKRAFDYLKVAESLNSFVKEKGIAGTDIEDVFNNRISMVINDALSVIVKNSVEEQRQLDKELGKLSFLMKPMRTSTILRYRFEGVLFSVFPCKFTLIYKILKKFDWFLTTI